MLTCRPFQTEAAATGAARLRAPVAMTITMTIITTMGGG